MVEETLVDFFAEVIWLSNNGVYRGTTFNEDIGILLLLKNLNHNEMNSRSKVKILEYFSKNSFISCSCYTDMLSFKSTEDLIAINKDNSYSDISTFTTAIFSCLQLVDCHLTGDMILEAYLSLSNQQLNYMRNLLNSRAINNTNRRKHNYIVASFPELKHLNTMIMLVT